MARLKWQVISIIVIWVLVATLRIYLAYQSTYPDYDGYLVLRQVEHIQTTGVPLLYDELSYGGRTHIISPFSLYVLSGFGFFVPDDWLIKVIPNLLFASSIIPIFLFARYITNKPIIAGITAAMAGIVPASIWVGINNASSMMLSIPFLFWAAYLFLKSNKNVKHLSALLVILTLLILTDILGIILLIGFFFYLIIAKVEYIKITQKEVEVILFHFVFTAWFAGLIYKGALLTHQTGIIWQNTPIRELANKFSEITFGQAISSTGLIPLIIGVVGMYIGLTTTKKKSLVLLSSMLLSILILLWFKLLPLTTGLLLLSITLIIATSYGLHKLTSFIQNTKTPWMAPVAVIIILLGFLTLSITTQPLENSPLEADVQVMNWARSNLPKEAIIMSSPKDGAIIEAIAQRKSVIDEDYLLIKRVEERYDDVIQTYQAVFKIDAIRLMQRYGATHLFVTKESAAKTGVDTPTFLVDSSCFHKVKQVKDPVTKQHSTLYERTCSLQEDDM